MRALRIGGKPRLHQEPGLVAFAVLSQWPAEQQSDQSFFTTPPATMGRRALRKIPAWLDLSGHLLTYDDLPDPWNAETLFGRLAPLEIEVGSGKGLFLRSAAEARAEVNFLGVEIAGKYARFAAAGLAKRGLDNARILASDGLRLFAERLPEACLAAVHVYFPDPWWKKRHRKRRLMRAGFVRDVERTLLRGGLLHFWTDVAEYFQSTLELLSTSTDLDGPFDVPESAAEHDLDYRTHFERRMRLESKPVYRSQFRKPCS